MYPGVSEKDARQLVRQIANKINIPLTNLALCWCLKNKNVSTVILGASKIEQLNQNIDSLNHLTKVDEQVMEQIEAVLST